MRRQEHEVQAMMAELLRQVDSATPLPHYEPVEEAMPEGVASAKPRPRE